MRVLMWIVDRVRGRVLARETPLGWMPRMEDVDWRGLPMSCDRFEALQTVDIGAWRREVIDHEELFIELHDHLPPELVYERELLICRL
jgi:phosphoenolpyruvate carboxykinase (GTP)